MQYLVDALLLMAGREVGTACEHLQAFEIDGVCHI